MLVIYFYLKKRILDKNAKIFIILYKNYVFLLVIGLTWFLAGSVTFTIVSCLMTVGISAWLDDGDESIFFLLFTLFYHIYFISFSGSCSKPLFHCGELRC